MMAIGLLLAMLGVVLLLAAVRGERPADIARRTIAGGSDR